MTTAPLQRRLPDAPPVHFLTLDELGPGRLRSLLDLTGSAQAVAGGVPEPPGRRSDRHDLRQALDPDAGSASSPPRGSLGMLPIVLRPDELQLGRGETIGDTARALSLYLDGAGGPRRSLSSRSRSLLRPRRSRSSTP